MSRAGRSGSGCRPWRHPGLVRPRLSREPASTDFAVQELHQFDWFSQVDDVFDFRAEMEARAGGDRPSSTGVDHRVQLERARALVDLGAALRRQGHRLEAREPLREALEIAARCGAVPLMEQVQTEALAAGARPRRPRLRGVDALTPSELRVARLAAEGRSNPEIAQALFITTRTVADHLTSSYSKLDINSREQLTTALGLSTP